MFQGYVGEIVWALRYLIEEGPRSVRALVRHVELGERSSLRCSGETPAGVNLRFVGDHICTGIRLGKGMFGTVFLGYSIITGEKVALKVWKPVQDSLR